MNNIVEVPINTLSNWQKMWLPKDHPEDVKVLRCTKCQTMRVVVPGSEWDDHDKECGDDQPPPRWFERHFGKMPKSEE